MIKTPLTRKYGLKMPVAQAGMAFVGMTPHLAIAVSSAGGLGSVAVGRMPAEAVRANIRAIRAATRNTLNVNMITIFAEDAHIDMLCEERVDVASFHWGHPSLSWIKRLQAAGTDIWEQVGNIDAAKRALDDGVTAIVAQGSEAGGHNYGTLPTFVLVPSIVDVARDAPVLAAGGIVDGRGLAAALALGAVGAWIGTRLVMTDESMAHPEYKRRLIHASGTDTTLTSIFGPEHPDFNPMRVLRNRCVEQNRGREAEIPVDTSGEPVIGTMDLLGQRIELRRFTNLVPMPGTEGDFEELPLLAGQGVGLIHSIEAVGTVLQRMADEAEQILGKLAGACEKAKAP